jgi:hypothetical protein
MPDKIKEARRVLFEAWASTSAYLGIGSDELKRDSSDGYEEIETHIAWLGFNAALDAVEIKLPEPISEHNTNANGFVDPAAKEYDGCLDDCRAAIESTGLGLRIK